MEFLPSEIARLVLGYLEDEKCDSAYDTFLTTSPNLAECLKMKEMGKKFRTQVIGLSLTDILYEYSAIYCSVHERLKKVDPETAESLRSSGSLLDKLTFLLNANGSGQTMLFSITLPHGKSPTKSAVAHVRKRCKPGLDRTKDRLRKRVRNENDSICEELNESIINPSDVDTTPLCSLPGNNHLNVNDAEDNSPSHKAEAEGIGKTPKRKCATSVRKTRVGSAVSDVVEENLDMLTKALIDNHELHEKIAENINRVIHTPDIFPSSEGIAGTSTSLVTPQFQTQTFGDGNAPLKPLDSCASSGMYSTSFCTELDNAIKKIVEQTESDPVFETILLDVIDPLVEETSDDCEDRGISDTSTPQKAMSDQINDGSNSSDQGELNKTVISAKSHRIRHTRTKFSASETNIEDAAPLNVPCKIIEDQNADAIKSIIAVNSKLKEQQEELKRTIEDQVTTKVETILSDSVVNTSMIQTTTVTTTTSSINMNAETKVSMAKTNENINLQHSQGLVIGQSNPNIVVISHGTSSVVSQPTFVLAPASTSFPKLESQVLFLGNKGQLTTPQFVIQPPQSQYQTLITERDIMAMPTVIMYGDDRKATCSNTFSVSSQPIYSSVTKVTQPKPIINILPKKKPEPEKPVPQLSITLYAGDENSTQDAKMNIQPIGNLQVTISPSKPGRSVPMILTDSVSKEIPLETPKIVTPPKVNSHPRQSMSTPRSGKSHIRALDFSTPPKDGISTRKANTSPKSTKRLSSSKKSSKRKGIRTSLFSNPSVKLGPLKLPTDVPIATRTPCAKLSGDWDNIQGTGLILGNASQTDEKSSKEGSAMKNKLRKKGSSWDEDLRALCSAETVKVSNAKRVRKNLSKNTRKRKVKKKNEDLNKTEEEVNKIELALNSIDDEKTVVKIDNKVIVDKDDVKIEKNSKDKAPRRRETRKKSTTVDTKDTSLPIDVKEEKISDVKSEIVMKNETENVVNETNMNLRNMRPRVNKKCNVGIAPRKVITTQTETVISKPEKEDNTNMKVFSPSKFNANKRSLVENEIPKLEQVELPAAIPLVVEKPEIESTNKITPTMFKISEENPITFKTNLTPILETPMKYDPLLLPVTPKIFTPFSTLETPFSKILKENMGSVDFSSIPTPSFPLTPSFTNFTPNAQLDGEPYNRPTDYSTSSSYYQPSDSEHNHVLDMVLIEESKTMDKKLSEDHKSDALDSSDGKDILTADCPKTDDEKATEYVLHEISLISPVKKGSFDKTKYEETNKPEIITEENILTCSEEKESNISFVESEKHETSSSSSSCSGSCYSTSNSSSSDESSDAEETKKDINQTVIEVVPKETPDTSIGRYSLRSRRTPSKELTSSKEIPAVKPIKISIPKKKIIKTLPEEESLPESTRALQSLTPKEIALDKTKQILKNISSNEAEKGPIIENLNPPDDIYKKDFYTQTFFEQLDQPSTSQGIRIARPKVKSTVAASILENLAEKCNRVKQAIKTESMPGSSKRNAPVRKPRVVKPKVVPSIVPKKSKSTAKKTPANVTKSDETTKRESISPRKQESIESVAARLMHQNQDLKVLSVVVEDLNKQSCDAKTEQGNIKLTGKKVKISICMDDETKKKNEEECDQVDNVKMIKNNEGNSYLEIKRKSIDSAQDESKVSDVSTDTFKEEELPRLHLSSDEEEVISHDVKNLLTSQNITEIVDQNMEHDLDSKKLRELKERGIHLIPKNIGKVDKIEKDQVTILPIEQVTIPEDEKNFSKLPNQKVQVHNIIVLDKNEKIDFSNMEADNCIKTDIISKVSKKNQDCIINNVDRLESIKTKKSINTKNKEPEKQNAEIKCIVIDSKEDQTVIHPEVKEEIVNKNENKKERHDSLDSYNFSLADDVFEVTTCTDDSPSTFKFIYNESTACKRTLEEYNIDDLPNRDITASVYSEDLGREITKHLTISPYTELYSSIQKSETSHQKDEEKKKSNAKRNAKLMLQSSEASIIKSINNKKEILDKDNKSSIENVESSSSKAEKSVDDQKKNKTDKSKNKTNEESKIKEKQVVKRQKTQERKEMQSKGKASISLEQYKNRQNEQKINDTGHSSIDEKISDSKIDTDEDELMEFALIGTSKHISNVEQQSTELNWKKRKLYMDSDIAKLNPEKRNKHEDNRILRNVDIETFLTKVHGPSDN